jgi:SAM-dependent methyltransferase
MNWFSHSSAAERYASGRPDFHPAIFDRIVEEFDPPRFGRALYVGCGTGQSSIALLRLAARVAAMDASAPMLERRRREAGIEYAQGDAGALPFAGRTFDAVAAGLAFHDGWLFVYNHWFLGRMAENPGFEEWFRDEYLTGFPGPPRDLAPIAENALSSAGLTPTGRATFEHDWSLTTTALVAHLVSQTNVIAAVEGGGREIGAARRSLREGVAPLFAGERGTFRFAGSIDCYRKG